MKTALIGYTGFVGSNILKQNDFTDLYNSKNISDIKGKEYDLVVCAGVKAVKWWANKNPKEDFEGIQFLIENLKEINAKKFILISTVDVYPIPIDVDEDFDFTKLNKNNHHAYGLNRLYLEIFIKKTFNNCSIVRLPGLFGEGLKKNIIYDLLNNNIVENIIPNFSIQYYYLENIWSDIKKVIDNNLRVINLNSEPILSSEIQKLFFPNKKIGTKIDNPIIYDYKTKYYEIFGGKKGYMYSKNHILDYLNKFINNYKKGN